MEQDKETENPLIQSLSNEDVGEKKARKAEMWFQKIGDLEDDSDLESEIRRCYAKFNVKVLSRTILTCL